MSKNRAGFIIATFEGLKVNWPVIVADSIKVEIQSVVDGIVANPIGTPNTSYQIEEAGPTGGYNTE